MDLEHVQSVPVQKAVQQIDLLQPDLMSLYLDSLLYLSPESTVSETLSNNFELDNLSAVIQRDMMVASLPKSVPETVVKPEARVFQGIMVKVGSYEVLLELSSLDHIYLVNYSSGHLCNIGTYHVQGHVLRLLDFALSLQEKKAMPVKNLDKVGHIIAFANQTLGFHCELISGPECFPDDSLKLYSATKRMNPWIKGYSLQKMRPIINLVDIEKAIFPEKC